MALIYSFTTPDGVTHGEPDSAAEGQPSNGVLIGPNGPFAGQRLEVRYASTESGPAAHPYVLECGARLFPTFRVHKVLCPPQCRTGKWPA